MDMYYNYIYLDPRKPGKYEYNNICFLYEPIYVGKGKNNRMFNHIRYYKYNKKDRINKILYNKLHKIYSSNNNPIIIDFNYSHNEQFVYDNEKQLILNIGTIDGETTKRGPLCNFCIDNRPPSHKGKTYIEIYGEEGAKKQIQKRKELQKNGGYNKGNKHTAETLKLLSKLQSGKGNARYNAIVTQETRNKISNANKGRLSKRALKYLFISPNNIKYLVTGHDKKHFCNTFNLSFSTLNKKINTGIDIKYGKTKGWLLYKYNNQEEEEIISYTVGAFNQDMDDTDYSDLI